MPDMTGAINITPEVDLADPEPLSRRMLAAIAPHVPKRPVGLEVVGMDVHYSTFMVNGAIMTGYAFLLTVKGALIGTQYHITNAHILAPAVPDAKTAQEAVHISTAKLREAKVAQARQVMGGPNSNG